MLYILNQQLLLILEILFFPSENFLMFQQQVLCIRETSLNKERDLNIILNGSSFEGYITVDEIYSMNLYFKACSYFKEQLKEIKMMY